MNDITELLERVETVNALRSDMRLYKFLGWATLAAMFLAALLSEWLVWVGLFLAYLYWGHRAGLMMDAMRETLLGQ